MPKTYIYPIAIFLAFLPWIIFNANNLLLQDVSWLLLSATRFLEGQTMTESFYETNPPLIILLFSVPAMMAKVTHLPAYIMPFYFCISGALITTYLTHKILSYNLSLIHI